MIVGRQIQANYPWMTWRTHAEHRINKYISILQSWDVIPPTPSLCEEAAPWCPSPGKHKAFRFPCKDLKGSEAKLLDFAAQHSHHPKWPAVPPYLATPLLQKLIWLWCKDQPFTPIFQRAPVRLHSAHGTMHAFAKPPGVPTEAAPSLGTRQLCMKDVCNAKHLGLGLLGGLSFSEDVAKPPHCDGRVKWSKQSLWIAPELWISSCANSAPMGVRTLHCQTPCSALDARDLGLAGSSRHSSECGLPAQTELKAALFQSNFCVFFFFFFVMNYCFFFRNKVQFSLTLEFP